VLLFLDEVNMTLPEWLISLLACCCYGECFDIQASALSTLLDLINVTLTVNHSSDKNNESRSKITPLVTKSNLKWMQNSNLFKVSILTLHRYYSFKIIFILSTWLYGFLQDI